MSRTTQPKEGRRSILRYVPIALLVLVGFILNGGITVQFDSTLPSVLVEYGLAIAVIGGLILTFVKTSKTLIVIGLVMMVGGIAALLGGYYQLTGVSPLDAEFWRKAISAGRW